MLMCNKLSLRKPTHGTVAVDVLFGCIFVENYFSFGPMQFLTFSEEYHAYGCLIDVNMCLLSAECSKSKKLKFKNRSSGSI